MKTLLLLAFAVVSLGAQAPSSSLVGAYTCQGQQDSGAYTLQLTVKAHRGTKNFVLSWAERPDSPTVMSGLAIRQFDQLAVALVTPDGAIGVASYVVTPGHLNGVWAMGSGAVFPEHCQMGEPL